MMQQQDGKDKKQDGKGALLSLLKEFRVVLSDLGSSGICIPTTPLGFS